jgi:hypothetical protein
MAATVSEALAGLREAIAQIPGLRVVEYLPDQINPPVAVCAVDEVTYHQAFAGGDPQYQLTVTVIVDRASERIAQKKLDAFLSYGGTQSVRAAVEADMSLGGAVQQAFVHRASNIQIINVNEVIYLAVDFTVIVHA